MNSRTHKNGLTEAQVLKAREIFAQVSLSKICKEQNISLHIVNHVLRGNSGRLDVLKVALDAATKAIEDRKQLLASIPAA